MNTAGYLDTAPDKRATRTAQTEAVYERRFAEWMRAFPRENNKPSMTVEEVIAELIARKRNGAYAQRTWRSYKAAATYYLIRHHGAAEDALAALSAESSAGLSAKSGNTSGKKSKNIDRNALQRICTHALERARNGSMYGQLLYDYMQATLLTGLRPHEWADANFGVHLETGRQVLIVSNSKFSNGRANGPLREMFVDTLTESELDIIKRLMGAFANTSAKEQKTLGNGLTYELRAVRKALIAATPKTAAADSIRNIALYSARHQFAANAKSTFDDPVIIAALMGHSSTKTAFQHYGRRVSGNQRIKVLPTPESIAAVQKIHLESYKDFAASHGASPR